MTVSYNKSFQVTLWLSIKKRILVKNLSYENELGFFETETVEETHLHINGFSQTHFNTGADGNQKMTHLSISYLTPIENQRRF